MPPTDSAAISRPAAAGEPWAVAKIGTATSSAPITAPSSSAITSTARTPGARSTPPARWAAVAAHPQPPQRVQVRAADDRDQGRGMDDATDRHPPRTAAQVDEPSLYRPRQRRGDRQRAHDRARERQRSGVLADDKDDPDPR